MESLSSFDVAHSNAVVGQSVMTCPPGAGQWWAAKLYVHWSVRTKSPYTLAVGYENSIYIEPFLSHNDTVIGALKSSTVKRNDTGLQSASLSEL